MPKTGIVRKLTSGLTPSFAGGMIAPGQMDELQSDFGPIVQQITGSPMQAPRQNFLLPEPGSDGFFGQHPRVAQGIENALLALANTHGGETIGDSLSSIAAGLFSVPQARRQYQAEQLQSQIGAAGQLAQMKGLIAPTTITTPAGLVSRNPQTGALSPGMSLRDIAKMNGTPQTSSLERLTALFPDAPENVKNTIAGYAHVIDNEPNPEKASMYEQQAIAHLTSAASKSGPKDFSNVFDVAKAKVESELGPMPERTDPKFQSWINRYSGEVTRMQSAPGVQRAQILVGGRMVPVIDTQTGNLTFSDPNEIHANGGRFAPAGEGGKSMNKLALINDIRQAAKQVESNSAIFDNPALQRAGLAASLANPSSTLQSFMQSIPRGQLNDKEQQAVADIFNLKENAMALRTVLGAGQGSEDLRAAILNTLPGPGTPSSKFAKKQLANLYKTLDRVSQGVPNVPLRPADNGLIAPGAPANSVPVYDLDGNRIR